MQSLHLKVERNAKEIWQQIRKEEKNKKNEKIEETLKLIFGSDLWQQEMTEENQNRKYFSS